MIWSYLLASVGILGIFLAGRRNLWGWAVGGFAQGLWIIYALVTTQYGFIVSALAYAAVYARNWWKWRQEDLAAATPQPDTITTLKENTADEHPESRTDRGDHRGRRADREAETQTRTHRTGPRHARKE